MHLLLMPSLRICNSTLFVDAIYSGDGPSWEALLYIYIYSVSSYKYPQLNPFFYIIILFLLFFMSLYESTLLNYANCMKTQL